MTRHSDRPAKSTTSGVQDERRRLLEGAVEREKQELLDDIGYKLWHFRVCDDVESLASLAKEVFQEMVVTALESIDRYDSARPAKLWLQGIATNVILHLRRDLWQKQRHISLVADTGAVKRASSREKDKDLSEEKMFAVLSSLSANASSVQALSADEILSLVGEKHQEILRLRYVEGFDGEELAARLGTSVGTAYKRLSRARNELRQAFLNDDN